MLQNGCVAVWPRLPVICKTMFVVGSGGYQDCMFCNLQVVHNENLHKTVNLQNRRFLSAESSLRNDRETSLMLIASEISHNINSVYKLIATCLLH